MIIKAYHSESVESAIRQASLELGDDAVLLDSRKTTPDERHLGLYEVRFAFTSEKAASRSPARMAGDQLAAPGDGPAGRRGRPAGPSGRPAGPAGDQLAELSEGIQEIRRMLYSYTHTCYLPTGEFLCQPQLARLYRDLTANDLAPEPAAQLVAALTPLAERGATQGELEQSLVGQLLKLLAVSDELGRSGFRPPTVALVGPTGVGKTATLVKLAVQYGLRERRRVHLVTTDNFRVAAVHQIETYAGILGVDWTAVDEVKELRDALDGFQDPEGPGADFVLIDTPGYGLSEMQRSAELAEFLGSRADIDVHLVLSASTKPRDLHRLIEEYRIFGPRKLLFTKLDETLSFGSLLNEAMRTRWPISFLGTGQRVPEDLLAATRDALAGWIGNRAVGAVGR